MSTKGDRRTFRNEDLVFKVTTNIDPKVWDESKYEAFLNELCGYRESRRMLFEPPCAICSVANTPTSVH